MDIIVTSISICVIAFGFIYAGISYNTLPNKIPIHYNYKLEADAFASKHFIFLFPSLTLICYIMLQIIMKYDKYKENYSKFIEYYRLSELSIMSFLNYLLCLTVLSSKNNNIDIVHYLLIGIGLEMICIGISIYKSKMTQYFGVKIRYAYLSDTKWEYVNKRGGILIIICGCILLLGFIFKWKLLLIIPLCLLVSGLIMFCFYCNLLYLQETKNEIQIYNNIV